MDVTGEHRIAAARERVWKALNDPEVLKQCIPAGQSINFRSSGSVSASDSGCGNVG